MHVASAGTFRWSGQEYVEDPEKIKWDKMMAERKASQPLELQ
jgi:hypothetical protein